MTPVNVGIARDAIVYLVIGAAAEGIVRPDESGRQPIGQCIALASFTATPLFLIGFLQVYPVLWLNLVAGLPVLAFTTYLFYTGIPIMMEISRERGFLFSSAMLAFGLVTLVAMLAVTALLWGTGFAPAFTS